MGYSRPPLRWHYTWGQVEANTKGFGPPIKILNLQYDNGTEYVDVPVVEEQRTDKPEALSDAFFDKAKGLKR